MPAVAKTIVTDEQKAELERQETLRKRAARQAARRHSPMASIDVVECTVLPMGADRISMGEHMGGLGEAHYEEGETFEAQLPTAVALYRRGFVNFEGAREAEIEDRKRHMQEIEQAAVEKREFDAAVERGWL